MKMENKKTLKYQCDTCGEIIDDLNGWVEWLVNDKNEIKDFRICHHTPMCQKHSHHIYGDGWLCNDIDLYNYLRMIKLHINDHIKNFKECDRLWQNQEEWLV